MKKIFTTLLSVAMIVACASQASAKPADAMPHFKVEHKTAFRDIDYRDRVRINDSVKQCFKDGDAAAKTINELKDNKTDFEIGVRKVLDRYYSMEKSERGQLKDFSKKVDKSAKKILENYKEAQAERENSEALPFETEEVLVSFPYGTPMDTIETVVGNEAVSFEVIDNGEFDIPDDLPDYKKERLAAIKDLKTDIVVCADISLEDTVERAVEKFEEYDCVTNVECNSLFEADGVITNSGSVSANDPHFNETTQWNLKSINIPAAWNRFNSVSGIYEIWVAVIDSGFKMNHEDLKNMYLTNYCVDVTQGNKKLVNLQDAKHNKGQYTSAHGTRVTGVLAAQGNNAKGIAGVGTVASNATFRNWMRIMAIKCDDTVDEDRHINQAHLATAIKYATSNGAEVINISYSALKSTYSSKDFSNVQSAISAAIKAGVTVVCAAGNDSSTTVRYPAGFDGVIGVGAHLKNGNLADYSNKSSAVDIVAPGGFATSGGAQVKSTNTDGSYSQGHGTSYATPHVAATVAMMKSINYSLTPSGMLTRLQSRSTKKTIGGKVYNYLNAGEAVRLTAED